MTVAKLSWTLVTDRKKGGEDTGFAKLFESEELGQILVMKDTSDEGLPCIVLVFDPRMEGVEVMRVQYGFDDEDRRNQLWDDATRSSAESEVRRALRVYVHE